MPYFPLSVVLIAALAGYTTQAAGELSNASSWVFSPQNNGPSTLDRMGGPVLVYNGVGVPGVNALSSPPQINPLSVDVLAGQLSAQLEALYKQDGFAAKDACLQCRTAVMMGKTLAMSTPSAVGPFMSRLCSLIGSGNPASGNEHAQVLQRLNYGTDVDYYCRYRLNVHACPEPAPIEIKASEWFKSSRPANATAPPPSGKTFKAIHFSDWHLDPLYAVGAESKCSGGQCCREHNHNQGATKPQKPASRYGAISCDTPADLGLSAFKHMRQTLNFSEVAMAIFTGDLISHDARSDAYVTYSEVMSYMTFKAQLGDIPVYSALGNHDTNPTDAQTDGNFYDPSGAITDFNTNYALVSSLWAANNWIGGTLPEQANTHFGAYSVLTHGRRLKVITYNTDFWYRQNLHNYANTSNPDVSGTLRFLISELESAEAARQRVWLVGHVISGYDGGDSLPNPTSLFYAIVQRFSPHVIAGIFFGHTHHDQMMIYYDAPVRGDLPLAAQAKAPLAPINHAWIGPSISPVSGDNPAWRAYDIDAETFSVVGAQTYFSDLSDTSAWTEPVWQAEYDSRTAYDPASSWPAHAPLNATFWEGVARAMARNETGLARLYHDYGVRHAPGHRPCVDRKCIDQTVCWIRSGSAAMGSACAPREVGRTARSRGGEMGMDVGMGRSSHER